MDGIWHQLPMSNTIADYDSSLGHEILNISVTEIKSVVEPDGITDYVWRKAMTFVCAHGLILSIWAA
jgi:hypothetical protein